MHLLPRDIYPHIPNLRKVHDWLYRGGQINSQSIDTLKGLNIKTVICLRSTKKEIEAEKQLVESAGLKFISFPMTYLCWPDQNLIDEFFQIIESENKADRPIYLHCKHGCDRTGMLIAFWRMARDQWTFSSAYEEMVVCGYHRFKMRHFKWAVKRFSKSLLTPSNPSKS